MKKGIVIIRGNPENHDKSRMEQYIQQNQIEVIGDGVEVGWFYDYRAQDSDWVFERYEDRLAFLKSVERKARLILVEQDFFSYIGQNNPFPRKQLLLINDMA